MAQGLLPLYIHPGTGEATTQTVSMGAMGDSYYEYLLKARPFLKAKPPCMQINLWPNLAPLLAAEDVPPDTVPCALCQQTRLGRVRHPGVLLCGRCGANTQGSRGNTPWGTEPKLPEAACARRRACAQTLE